MSCKHDSQKQIQLMAKAMDRMPKSVDQTGLGVFLHINDSMEILNDKWSLAFALVEELLHVYKCDLRGTKQRYKKNGQPSLSEIRLSWVLPLSHTLDPHWLCSGRLTHSSRQIKIKSGEYSCIHGIHISPLKRPSMWNFLEVVTGTFQT